MSDEADDRRARHAPPVTPQRGSGSAPRTPPRGAGGYPRDTPQRGHSGRGTGSAGSAASSGPPEPIFSFGKFQGQMFGTATVASAHACRRNNKAEKDLSQMLRLLQLLLLTLLTGRLQTKQNQSLTYGVQIYLQTSQTKFQLVEVAN